MKGNEAQNWLLGAALPLWAKHGVDYKFGGFHERLTFSLEPLPAAHRARLTARQIYCFAAGEAMGWRGPADRLIAHGLGFLEGRLLHSDGRVIMAIEPETGAIRPGHDNYDVAFVLFTLGTLARRGGEEAHRLETLARRIASRLTQGWAHPEGGYQESAPPSVPLRSNPHMHLLEAFLEWVEVASDADGFWLSRAQEIADLALTRMLLPSGAMPELFDLDWTPVSDDDGLLIEPGHQFEWGWLLARWARIGGTPADFAAACRLIEIGERHGVDPRRGIAFNEMRADFSPRDLQAKLWPQTERSKAWHELATSPLSPPRLRAQALAQLPLALGGLSVFLTAPPEGPVGMWREVMRPDGSFIDEPVRASSFYHVVCALRTVFGDVPIPTDRDGVQQ